MTRVIYADVLVVLNTYVTYLLLLLTGIIAKERAGRLRLVLSSLAGGLSALIILLPEAEGALLSVLRLSLAAALLIIAFGRVKLRLFFRLYAAFFAVSFLFAGLMLALWYFVSPSVYFNSGYVYFSLDSLSLIILTGVGYGITRLFAAFIGRRVPSSRVYAVELAVAGRVLSCRSFLDTGNSLTDPFTGYPAVILSLDKFREAFPEVESLGDIMNIAEIKGRYLPCTTVAGENMLMCFSPDRVRVKGISTAFDTREVVIAVTQSKLMGGEYDALLSPRLFENKTNERGEDYADAV